MIEYHNVHSPGWEEPSGFGLGLSVVRAYAERFGGRATVEDAPSGRGARFTFELREWGAREGDGRNAET